MKCVALNHATGWHLPSAKLRPAWKEGSYHGPDPMAPLPAWLTTAESLRAEPVIDRRTFLAGIGAVLLAAPLAVEAQRTAKVYRAGYLGASLVGRVHGGFEPGLVERGWTPGQNIIIEYRWYEGSPDRAQDLARELLRLRLDLVCC
jgi:hypothetical protein